LAKCVERGDKHDRGDRQDRETDLRVGVELIDFDIPLVERVID